MKVAELFVALGMKPDASWRRGVNMFRDLHHLGLGVAGIFGMKGLAGAMVGFNMKVEDAKNSIAGVLALAKGSQTTFNAELANANELYDGLRKKAAELPGTTQEYVEMLKMLAHPLARAGMSNQQMIDVTTGGLTAARGLGEGWQKTARDIREFINFGKMNAPDTFARLMFSDFDNEKGKKQLKSMTVAQRAQLMSERVNQKAMLDLQEAQKNSLSGRLDKLKDTLQVTMGKVGEGLAKALGPALDRAAKWVATHEKDITAFAVRLGEGLVLIFRAIAGIVEWLADHGDVAKAILVGIAFALGAIAIKAMLAWVAVLWPVLAGAGVVAALFYMFEKLRKVVGDLGAAMATIFVAKKIWDMVKAMRAMKTAAQGVGAAMAGGAGGRGRMSRIAAAMGMGGGGAGSAASLFIGGPGTMGFGSAGYNYAEDRRAAGANITPGSFNFGPGGYDARKDMSKMGRIKAAVGGAGMRFKSFLGSAASIVGRASPWIFGAMVASEFLPDSWKNAISGAISSGWSAIKGIFSSQSAELSTYWKNAMTYITGGQYSMSKDETALKAQRTLNNTPQYYITINGEVKESKTYQQVQKWLDEHQNKQLKQAQEALGIPGGS